MKIVGVDPGPDESAMVVVVDGRVTRVAELENDLIMLALASSPRASNIAIEDFVPYGVRLGQESMRTLKFIGAVQWAVNCVAIPRPDIKLHLCGTRTANDTDVRDALIHRFGANRKEAMGTKKSPGPLYGVKGHLWAALAVAVTMQDRLKEAGSGN